MDIKFIRHFSLNEKKKAFALINKIIKNVYDRSWKCLSPACTERAIKSHVLQKNGILSRLSVDSHVYCLSVNEDYNGINGKTYFKRVGVNKALAYPLFCEYHDREIFKKIEISHFDLFNYEIQLLFNYRAVCCELHKKRIGLELSKRALNSKTLDLYIDKENYRNSLQLFELGIRDCEFYKVEIEKEFQKSSSIFKIEIFEYPLIKVSASAIFSPLDFYAQMSLDIYKNVFINLIPYQDKLYIVIAYHKLYSNEWIENFIKSWKGLSQKGLEEKISELLATRIEAFCLSPTIVSKMDSNEKKKFLDYCFENVYNLSKYQFYKGNIFNEAAIGILN